MVAPLYTALPLLTSLPATSGNLRAAASRREALHDATLVGRFNAGDETAFVEIVARYRVKLSQVAWRLLKNHADAEEIAQDTFVRAHRGLAMFRGEASLHSWLHRIALNLARNRYWYFSRRRQHLTLSLDRPISDQNPSVYADLVASPAPGPVQEATQREFSALVATCMERLTPRQREILILRNGKHCSYREIGRQLGIDVGTVKSRVARAREVLRALLIQAYADTSPAAAGSINPWFEPMRSAGLAGFVHD